jgi:O-acetyl-ADP-ribose deacetylase (regulator of RNase III)
LKISYTYGDATNPIANTHKVIVHVCNDIGLWGAGFVLSLSKKWQEPESAYRQWHKSGFDFCLGNVQFVTVENDITVVNLIGQKGIKRTKLQLPPVRYEAIESGLLKVAQFAAMENASLHMPRIGCGLAGGDWEIIEKIIERTLLANNLTVTIYDLPLENTAI